MSENKLLNDAYHLEPITVSPHQLLVDPNNPRIALELDASKWTEEEIYNSDVQEEILDLLKKSNYINDLKNKIIARGWNPDASSPFIVKRIDNNKFRVLEGNCRTTAVKLLFDDENHRDLVQNIEIKEFIYNTENQNFSEEEAIRGVLAQIHLDAPNPWGPMERAKFVYDCYVQTLKHKSLSGYDESCFMWDEEFSEDAQKINSITSQEVRKMCLIFRVYASLKSKHPNDVNPDLYTLIELAVTSNKKVAKYFEINSRKLNFLDRSEDNFIQMCVSPKVIKNPKQMNKFKQILQHGKPSEIVLAEQGDLLIASAIVESSLEEGERGRRIKEALGKIEKIEAFSNLSVEEKNDLEKILELTGRALINPN